jgi:HEAT repeat protein
MDIGTSGCPQEGGFSMPDNAAVQALLVALRDPREGVRQHAVCKLIETGPEAIPDLIELLREKQGYAADCASSALVGMGRPAIPYLVQAMRHPDRVVRWGVASILSAMGEEARVAVDSSARLPAIQD